MWNVPNSLTIFRIALIPVFVVVYYLPMNWANLACASIFALAAATDWLDGYLARRLSQSTQFGAFLDPVADKLMVICALTMLVEHTQDPIITIPAMVMICREILISALREWMAEIGKRAAVKVSIVGKWKTMAQLAALTGLLTGLGGGVYVTSLVLLYAAVVLTFWSMFVYLNAAWPALTAK